MKIFIAMLSGFVLALATFGSGVVAAIVFLNAEPVPVQSPYREASGAWTREPVKVDPAEQELARLPARPSSEAPSAETQDEVGAEDPVIVSEEENLVDMTTTAAVSDQAAPQTERSVDPATIAAHVEWCSQRYRSYRPESNAYTPYSGGQRKCISPFSGALSANGWPTEQEGLGYIEDLADGSFVGQAGDGAAAGKHLSPEHIKSCMARYRSYRPEDNTYQPYGGGPRRECI